MSKFDNEYFFVLKDRDERMPEMTPDEDTASRQYRFKQIQLGSKPLIFTNGSLDFQIRKKITPITPPPDVLFDGTNTLVNNDVREKLLRYDIPNLAIQPAIYIDHKNVWHEDRWYLTFLERFDCWDRNNSTFDPDPISFDTANLYEIYTYSLNDELLAKTPLESRRLFKMGGATEGVIVAHMSIASLFQGTGAVLVPIEEYGVSFL